MRFTVPRSVPVLYVNVPVLVATAAVIAPPDKLPWHFTCVAFIISHI